jgi:hypothetical protein
MAVQCKYKFCLLVSILQCCDSSMKRADRKSSSEDGSELVDMLSRPARVVNSKLYGCVGYWVLCCSYVLMYD